MEADGGGSRSGSAQDVAAAEGPSSAVRPQSRASGEEPPASHHAADDDTTLELPSKFSLNSGMFSNACATIVSTTVFVKRRM